MLERRSTYLPADISEAGRINVVGPTHLWNFPYVLYNGESAKSCPISGGAVGALSDFRLLVVPLGLCLPLCLLAANVGSLPVPLNFEPSIQS